MHLFLYFTIIYCAYSINLDQLFEENLGFNGPKRTLKNEILSDEFLRTCKRMFDSKEYTVFFEQHQISLPKNTEIGKVFNPCDAVEEFDQNILSEENELNISTEENELNLHAVEPDLLPSEPNPLLTTPIIFEKSGDFAVDSKVNLSFDLELIIFLLLHEDLDIIGQYSVPFMLKFEAISKFRLKFRWLYDYSGYLLCLKHILPVPNIVFDLVFDPITLLDSQFLTVMFYIKNVDLLDLEIVVKKMQKDKYEVLKGTKLIPCSNRANYYITFILCSETIEKDLLNVLRETTFRFSFKFISTQLEYHFDFPINHLEFNIKTFNAIKYDPNYCNSVMKLYLHKLEISFKAFKDSLKTNCLEYIRVGRANQEKSYKGNLEFVEKPKEKALQMLTKLSKRILKIKKYQEATLRVENKTEELESISDCIKNIKCSWNFLNEYLELAKASKLERDLEKESILIEQLIEDLMVKVSKKLLCEFRLKQ